MVQRIKLNHAKAALVRADNRLRGSQAMLERLILANASEQEIEAQRHLVRVARETLHQHQAIVGRCARELNSREWRVEENTL